MPEVRTCDSSSFLMAVPLVSGMWKAGLSSLLLSHLSHRAHLGSRETLPIPLSDPHSELCWAKKGRQSWGALICLGAPGLSHLPPSGSVGLSVLFVATWSRSGKPCFSLFFLLPLATFPFVSKLSPVRRPSFPLASYRSLGWEETFCPDLGSPEAWTGGNLALAWFLFAKYKSRRKAVSGVVNIFSMRRFRQRMLGSQLRRNRSQRCRGGSREALE